jgi:hypothetical protein
MTVWPVTVAVPNAGDVAPGGVSSKAIEAVNCSNPGQLRIWGACRLRE